MSTYKTQTFYHKEHDQVLQMLSNRSCDVLTQDRGE